MPEVPVDEGALFVALALVPGFASRNRHPDLYASPGAMRARMRARRVRAFLQAARDANEAHAEAGAGGPERVTLTVRRHEPRSAWTLVGDHLDAAVCRYLLERGGTATEGHAHLLAVLPNDGEATLARALEAMPKLLGLP